jgi:hypothetical protein
MRSYIGHGSFAKASGDDSLENLNFSPELLGSGSVRIIMIVEDLDAAFERVATEGSTVISDHYARSEDC